MHRNALLTPIVGKSYPTVKFGKGVFLYDTEGREYLDGSSGAMTANIGHGVEVIAEAMKDQACRIAFTFRTQFTNEPAEILAERLTRLAPGDLNWAFFVNSGSEASEFAIRAAVNHWRESGNSSKVKVLGRNVSYHGMTMGALSMSGHPARRGDYGSLLHAFPVAPPAYAYRFAQEGESESEYATRAAAEFEEAILNEGPDTVAAIIAEPIVGAAGGVLVPPTGYFAKLREICDRLKILLIVDEVITGLGRTGDWFSSGYEGIVPDIILTGKGTSAGYSPIAAVLLRDHMIDTLREGTGTAPFGHTFSGNPLSAAVCLAVLDYIEDNKLIDNVKERGAQLEAGLRRLSQRYRHMVDVRGRGLLWGFEFVTDRATREAPDLRRNTTNVFVEECLQQGLIVYPAGVAPLNNATVIAPPFIISEQEMQILLDKLDRALAAMEAHIDQWVAEERLSNNG